VNYAFRFSGPVTALTACRVRYGVGPDLICQSGPSPGIKTHSSPAAFPTTLSLASFCSLPLSHLRAPPPSCLRPRRAPPTPLPRPLVPTEPIRRGQWEKCRSATADSYSLDASAALSRRPSDPVRRPLTMTPMKRPAFQQVAGDLAVRRPQILDHCYPSSKPRPPIYQTSLRLHRGRQGRVSTLTGRVTTTSPLPPPFTNLLPRPVLSREGLGPAQVTLRPG
jgi:hypothetical protein